jgi:hypothetical protein
MKIELDLDPEQSSEIVRHSLIESYKCMERYAPDDIIKSLMTVIEYYSNPTEYKEFLESITNQDL